MEESDSFRWMVVGDTVFFVARCFRTAMDTVRSSRLKFGTFGDHHYELP